MISILISILVCVPLFNGILLLVYRLFLHPLAKFPGPKLVAATKWYEFYKDVIEGTGGQFASCIDEMHGIYGPIVRVAPDELHVKDPQWFDVLYNSPRKVRDRYPPAAHMVATPDGTFGTVQHDIHRQRRAAVAPFFSKRSVTLLEPIFQRNIELLCKLFQRHMENDEVFDLHVDYLAYTTESVLNSAFNTSMTLLDSYYYALDWRKTMAGVQLITPFAKQFSWILPKAMNLPVNLVEFFSPELARLFKFRRQMYVQASKAIAENEIVKAASNNKAPGTLFEHILFSSLPDHEKLPDRMAQEAFVILAAGSETTAKILTIATFHILNNESDHQRLKKELELAIPTPQDVVDTLSLMKLPWLTALIKESLRIAALVTSRLPLVSPHESLYYNDWEIPAGTPVSMTLGSILTDPEIYPDPHTFLPGRWLRDDPNYEIANQFLVSFNKGTRSCIGMNFAYAELYLVLASIFRRFELELYDTSRERDIDHTRDYFLGLPSPESKGVRVRVVETKMQST